MNLSEEDIEQCQRVFNDLDDVINIKYINFIREERAR
jgi:hypothetical protein